MLFPALIPWDMIDPNINNQQLPMNLYFTAATGPLIPCFAAVFDQDNTLHFLFSPSPSHITGNDQFWAIIKPLE